MIPDALAECRETIADYLERFPQTYAPHEAELRALCALLAEMEAQLRTPFLALDDHIEGQS
jgi:hypothetical protein